MKKNWERVLRREESRVYHIEEERGIRVGTTQRICSGEKTRENKEIPPN